MGAGGGSQPTTTTVNQNSLPAYAQPYFTDIMQQAQAVTSQPYIPYGYTQNATGAVARATYKDASGNDQFVNAQRIADFTPGQQALQQKVAGMTTPDQITQGSQMAAAAGLGSLYAGQYNPNQFNEQRVAAPQLYDYGMGSANMAQPGTFGDAEAKQYMSPYINNVLDVQKQNALRNAQQGQLTQNLGAARQGTYGGSGQLIATTERENNLQRQMGEIDATGLQSAYQSAQGQYNADQGRTMQAQLANLSNDQQAVVQNLASQLQTQGLGAQQAMQAALANQSTNFQAQQGTEQSRQFGADTGLRGLAQALQSGQTLGNLGQLQSQSDFQILNAQQQAEQQKYAQQQQILDQQYGDFLRQRDYPMEQLGQYSNLLRGIPVPLNSTQTSYAPPPSAISQIGGLGLGALGLSKLGGP